MAFFEHNGVKMAYAQMGAGVPVFIWAHGWGQRGAALAPLQQALNVPGTHIFLDFPGFGASPLPPLDWGVGDYAALSAAFLRTLPAGPKIWVGHSFGCRVGIRLAAQNPDLIDRMVLIAAPGLKRDRPWYVRLKMWAKVRLFKFLKLFVRGEDALNRLRARFGSADYRNAGAIRPVFLKTIAEDLTEDAKRVPCPVTLIYGENDNETPPEIGERFRALMKNTALHVLPHLDHYSVLDGGRHQTAQRIREALA